MNRQQKKKLNRQYKRITRKKIISKSYPLILLCIATVFFVSSFFDIVARYKISELEDKMSKYKNCYFFIKDWDMVNLWIGERINKISEEEISSTDKFEPYFEQWRDEIMGKDGSKYEIVGTQAVSGNNRIVSSGNYDYTYKEGRGFSDNVNEVILIRGKGKIGDVIEINNSKLTIVGIADENVYLSGTFSYYTKHGFASLLGYFNEDRKSNLYILNPKNTEFDSLVSRGVYCFDATAYTDEELNKIKEYGRIYTFPELSSMSNLVLDMSIPIFVISFLVLIASYVAYLRLVRNVIARELYIYRLYGVSCKGFLRRIKYNPILVFALGIALGKMNASQIIIPELLYVMVAIIILVYIIANYEFGKYDKKVSKKRLCEKYEALFYELSILENIEYLYELKEIKTNINMIKLLRDLTISDYIYDKPEILSNYHKCTLMFVREVVLDENDTMEVEDFWVKCTVDEHERAGLVVEKIEKLLWKKVEVEWAY